MLEIGARVSRVCLIVSVCLIVPPQLGYHPEFCQCWGVFIGIRIELDSGFTVSLDPVSESEISCVVHHW